MIFLKIFSAPLRGALPFFIFGLDDAAAVGLGSLVLGGGGMAASAIAQGDLNRENRDWSEMMNQRTYDQARQTNQAQMQFQEHMFDRQAELSNSAYQRATQDMEKAGLNPVLALMKGGADGASGGSGGGATGSVSSPNTGAARFDNPTTAAIASAAEVNRLKNENLGVVARVNKDVADAAQSSAAADVAKAQRDKIVAETKQVVRDFKSGTITRPIGEAGAKISEGLSNSVQGAQSIWDKILDQKQKYFDWKNNNKFDDSTGMLIRKKD